MTVLTQALRTVVPRIPTMSRAYAAQAGTSKVAVLGAAGGIGQPLSLLLKSHPHAATHMHALSLYDIVNTPGVAADLSHINTSIHVTGHVGKDSSVLHEALKDCEIVVIPAGVPRKPGMTRQDLFNVNAGIVRDLAKGIGEVCPKAHVLVISNPVNSTVPIVAEVLKKMGVYDRKRVYGVTTLDVVRASTFVGEVAEKKPQDVEVTVIGGHSGKTIVPLLSKVDGVNMQQEQIEKVTNRIQFGGDEVVKAKDGAGSATLSMAYAGARFTLNLLRAIHGESNIIEPAFVENDQFKEKNVSYFASRVTLGPSGAEQIHPVEVDSASDYEQKLIDEALNDLGKNIQDGVDFAAKL